MLKALTNNKYALIMSIRRVGGIKKLNRLYKM